MTAATKYEFPKATMGDLPMLLEWQAQPHVREWWGSDEPYEQKEITDPRVSRCIVSVDGRAFAFMQDYSVHGWEAHHFAHLPKGARGIAQDFGGAHNSYAEETAFHLHMQIAGVFRTTKN